MFLALLSAVLLTTSCLNVNLGNHQGKKIKASKTIVTKEMNPGAFDKLNVNVVAQVKFVQTEGEDCRVVLTAPDNYVALFSIESKKGELDIEYVKDNINIESKKVKIMVYGPQLSRISKTGVAPVRDRQPALSEPEDRQLWRGRNPSARTVGHGAESGLQRRGQHHP